MLKTNTAYKIKTFASGYHNLLKKDKMLVYLQKKNQHPAIFKHSTAENKIELEKKKNAKDVENQKK